MQLVQSINEALLNAEAFSGVGSQPDSKAYDNFGLFFHWYYFESIGVFAPSKFIGYKNTTLDNYKGEGTGTETKRVLSKWFAKLARSDSRYETIRENLTKYAKGIDKSISSKTFDGTGGIYLLREEFSSDSKPGGHSEGALKRITVNAYERNTKARAECIAHYGAKCFVCSFDFSATYGNRLGNGYIHVHHLIELSSIGEEYEVNAIEDLRPVCPNCHAMLHREKPALTIEALKATLREQT